MLLLFQLLPPNGQDAGRAFRQHESMQWSTVVVLKGRALYHRRCKDARGQRFHSRVNLLNDTHACEGTSRGSALTRLKAERGVARLMVCLAAHLVRMVRASLD